MSENTPEVNVDADQAVINTAPDGGGVDNNAPAEVETPAAEQPAEDAPAAESDSAPTE